MKLLKQRGVFLGILVTFGASMLENMLTGKGVIRAGRDVLRARRWYNSMDNRDKKF